MRILVADDDATQRFYISALLRKLGHEPVEAADGEEALRMLASSEAQILVCDLDMPVMDGLELTRRIRERRGGHYVHVVMVTGRDREDDRRRALDVGVDDFISKPFEASMLRVRISAAVRLVEHERQLNEKNRILREAHEQIRADLEAAALAQRRMLPLGSSVLGRCAFSASFVPSAFVSGDMFGYFELGQGRIGFYAIDVAGHGVQAALTSVAFGHLVTAEYFASKAIGPNGRANPAALAASLNRRFFKADSDEYLTLFAAVLDEETGDLSYCLAGYPPPLLVGGASGPRRLGDGGYPVGLLAQAVYSNSHARVEPGDRIVLFSDGATEAEDPEGTAFGDTRLSHLIENEAAQDASRLPRRVTEELMRWRQGHSLADDLTVLVMERRPAS